MYIHKINFHVDTVTSTHNFTLHGDDDAHTYACAHTRTQACTYASMHACTNTHTDVYTSKENIDNVMLLRMA